MIVMSIHEHCQYITTACRCWEHTAQVVFTPHHETTMYTSGVWGVVVLLWTRSYPVLCIEDTSLQSQPLQAPLVSNKV